MSEIVEGEKRYNFSFSRSGVAILMIGYGLLCFLFCGVGVYIGYDYGKQSVQDNLTEKQINDRPSSVVGETSNTPSTIVSLQPETTSQQTNTANNQETAFQPTTLPTTQAEPSTQNLPDSAKKVVNFRLNSTNVGKDSTTVIGLSTLRNTWEIQVAAVSKQDGAEKLVQDWKKKGITLFIVTITGKSGKKWYVVRTGRFDSKEKADAAAAALSKKLGLETIARPYGVF